MSNTLRISGNLEGVKVRAERIKRVITEAKKNGFPLWSKYEIWRYSSAGDHRVCPICGKYDGETFTGEQVKTEFPGVKYLGNYVAHPRTHDKPNFPDAGWIRDGNWFPGGIYRREGDSEGCGCRLILTNPAEAFEAQLHRRKLDVI